MTATQTAEIKGVTFPIIWSVIIGAFAMCCTVAGGVIHIEKAIAEQSGHTKALMEWKEEVTPQIRENTKDIAVINNILKIK